MKYLKLIVSIGAFLTSTILFAQEPLVLALPDTSTSSGDTLRLDITTRAFTAIVSFQFSMKFDPQVIRYAGAEMADLTGVAVGTADAANGALRFSWFDVQGAGQTLPDSSAIIRLKFFVNGANGTFSDLTITGMPLGIQVFRSNGNGGFEASTMTPQNGSVTVGAQNAFRASFTTTNVLCAGSNTGAISTTLINKPDNATIQWTGPNNFQSQQEDINNLLAGNYNLKVLNNSAILLDTIFIITQPATALSIDTITTVQASCTQSTGSAIVTAMGGVPPYRYSIGSNFIVSNQFNTLAPALYTLTVRDSNNCTVSDTFRIQAADAPQLNLADTISICNGQNAMLDAGQHASYLWSTGATTRSINISIAGTYRVTVTNAAGCSATDSVRVLAGSNLQLQLADSVAICTGQSTTLDAGIFATYHWSTGDTTRSISVTNPGIYRITVTNATGCSGTDSIRVVRGNNLQWQLVDSVSICAGQSTTLDAGVFASYRWSTGDTTRSLSVSTVGIYKITVTNAMGCSGTDSIRVVAGMTPQIQLADSVGLCNGQNIALDAGIHSAYNWSTGATSRAISVSAIGTYRVTVTNSAGCTASDSIRVVAAAAPTIELGDTTFICNGENVMLDAGEYASYRWSTGATTRSITVSAAGKFSVTITNSSNCTASDTIQVIADDRFEARIENDTLSICPGASLQLRASLADTYQWIDTSKTLSAVNIRNPIARPTVPTAYTLIASNSCGMDTATVEINVFEVTATAGPDTCIAPGDQLELYASGGVTYFWFLTDYPVSNPNIPNPTTQPEDSTSYFVMITDANGCQKFDTIHVMVANNPLDITAINMITPNGDGKNDVLEFQGVQKYGVNTLKIYNRWGDQVYQKINYQRDDERFDGTRNGKPLPAGNYFYVLSFQAGDIKQTLTIVRE